MGLIFSSKLGKKWCSTIRGRISRDLSVFKLGDCLEKIFEFVRVNTLHVWNNFILRQRKRELSQITFAFFGISWSRTMVCTFTVVKLLFCWPPKGQLISKCLFGIFNFPKKRTKKFDFTTVVPQVELSSFVFWENWRH